MRLIVVVLLCVAGVGSLAYYVKTAPADRLPIETIRPQKAEAVRRREGVQVPKPRFNESGNLEFHAQSQQLGKDEDSKVFVVNGFLHSLEGLQLTADSVDVDHGVAKIHFPADSRFEFGSTDESTFLLGLRSALGQFAEVDAIQLFVGGQPIEELGHQVIDIPLPVIRPSNWKNPTRPSSTPIPSEGN